MTNQPRVLVVDDDSEILSILKMYLDDFCDVTVAVDVSQCLTLLKRKIFDLLIVDIKLPEISGIEIVNMVREKIPGFPVVVISGFVDKIEQMIHDDACVKIVKPVEENDLVTVVKKLISTHGFQKKSVFSPGITLLPTPDSVPPRSDHESPVPGKNFVRLKP